jgi:coenzyme F420 hydrogenase subunit beta
MPKIRTVSDIVAWRMCLGCGACFWACKEGRIQLHNFLDEGIRPIVKPGDCGSCRDCLKVCPTLSCNFSLENRAHEGPFSPSFQKKWGPILAIWEGHAKDPEIRFKGASGGVLTALSLFCLEKGGMRGILHIGPCPENPLHNITRLSRTGEELFYACGSRYSPASLCDGLGLIEDAPGPCAIIGRPVEIGATQNAMALSPTLKEKVGIRMSFFCAEAPSTRGTLELIKMFGLSEGDLAQLRYRGHGWPGEFVVVKRGDSEPSVRLSYRESWGFLQRYRPWASQLWPDGGGELADITCGDPWYREPDGKDPGSSLVIARTRRGRLLVEEAMRQGYLELKPAEPWKLERSQWGLLQKKGSVWGRRLALRTLGLPVGRFPGMALFPVWLTLPRKEKLKSMLGTYRRILSRGLFRPLTLVHPPARGRP